MKKFIFYFCSFMCITAIKVAFANPIYNSHQRVEQPSFILKIKGFPDTTPVISFRTPCHRCPAQLEIDDNSLLKDEAGKTIELSDIPKNTFIAAKYVDYKVPSYRVVTLELASEEPK